jgi:hypothetical protein
MFCTSCGNELSENDKFCVQCGKSVRQASSGEEQPAPVESQPVTAFVPASPAQTSTSPAQVPASPARISASPFQAPVHPAQMSSSSAQTRFTTSGTSPVSFKNKAGLKGFAKGWMIFVIVAYSSVIASNLTYMTDPELSGILLPPLLCVGGMITGAAMVLKAKSQGLWVMIAFSVVLMLFNGTRYGNVMLITGMGLPFLFFTWLITRKQIHYGRKKTNN